LVFCRIACFFRQRLVGGLLSLFGLRAYLFGLLVCWFAWFFLGFGGSVVLNEMRCGPNNFNPADVPSIINTVAILAQDRN